MLFNHSVDSCVICRWLYCRLSGIYDPRSVFSEICPPCHDLPSIILTQTDPWPIPESTSHDNGYEVAAYRDMTKRTHHVLTPARIDVPRLTVHTLEKFLRI